MSIPRRAEAASRSATAQWPVAERSLLSTVLGVSPLAAVTLAAGLTALGVFADVVRIGTIGGIFTACYFAGCLLAVGWVRRRNLFGPMVQPPLLLAVAVPAVVLLVSAPGPGSGIAERLLVVGAPLVNSFPTMAVTTVAVLLLGAARIMLQRLNLTEDDEVSEPRDSDAAREAGRTSRSPRPS